MVSLHRQDSLGPLSGRPKMGEMGDNLITLNNPEHNFFFVFREALGYFGSPM